MDESIVIIPEHENGTLSATTRDLVAAARHFQADSSRKIRAIVLGDDVESPARQLAGECGLTVTAVHVPHLTTYNGEVYRQVLETVLADCRPDFVLIPHSSRGQDFAPGLAVRLEAACITGVERIGKAEGRWVFSRSIYGGKFEADVSSSTAMTVLTISPGAFPGEDSSPAASGRVEFITLAGSPERTRSLGVRQRPSGGTDLSAARVIVAAGRGVGEPENLELIERFADLFPRSAVAGSRIVCDAGWLDYDCQVGVTGATVSPDLYVACGISGAVQHIGGMRGAGFVVAINTDPGAAIFNSADVGIVEDLTTFIPRLIEVYKDSREI